MPVGPSTFCKCRMRKASETAPRRQGVDSDMFSRWLAYLQFQFGAQVDGAGRALSDTSWSARLQGSERLWMLLEGTHVLTLMLFAGSILFVDLRLLGLALPQTPVSRVTNSLLPYTVVGFVVMVLTGVLVFFANPLEYWHNFAFRVKIAFLVAAAINIFVFHHRVQADQARWDSQPRPPASVRRAAAASLALWIAVIVAGRCMAYEWFTCDKGGAFVQLVAQCAVKQATLDQIQPELAR